MVTPSTFHRSFNLNFLPLHAVCKVIWLDDRELLLSGAKLSSGLGIPAMDALILASLLMSGARTIVSIDSHLAGYKKKGVVIQKP